jgi:protein-S-isoprenylcysteine O-methyltransferase Ste14
MPPVYLLLGILAMIALHFLWPVRQVLEGPWRWAGVVPIALALGLGISAIRLFSRRKTTIKPGEVSTSLVTDGPFRFSRNPIYVGMTLILIGTALALGSVTPWLAVPVFVAVISWNIIPVEEGMLQEAFGDEYSQYRATVRRWI